jgi:hypothetical protein
MIVVANVVSIALHQELLGTTGTHISPAVLHASLIGLSRDPCSTCRPQNGRCIGECSNGSTSERGTKNSPRFGDRGSVLGASLKRVRKLTGATFEQQHLLLSHTTSTCRNLVRHGTSVRLARPSGLPDLFCVGDSFDIQAPAKRKGVLLLAH